MYSIDPESLVKILSLHMIIMHIPSNTSLLLERTPSVMTTNVNAYHVYAMINRNLGWVHHDDLVRAHENFSLARPTN